jgi:hypothetical protein
MAGRVRKYGVPGSGCYTQDEKGAQFMRMKGLLRGKEIVLERDLGIDGEVEVELTFLSEIEREVFGIWRGRDDIKDSTAWVRMLREREWQRY